jgi:predicted esterase
MQRSTRDNLMVKAAGRGRGRRRAAGVAVIVVALLAGSTQVADTEAKVRRGPAGLAFYDPPKLKRFPHGAGKPIWVRRAKGLVPLDNAASTRLLLYTSNSPKTGKRIAVSGSLSVPRGRPPKRGWPLISFAHGTSGVADICAPSRARPGGADLFNTTWIHAQAAEWLEAGYAVARTDYEGLGTPGPHPYLVGESEARGVIDIVRAARRLDARIDRRFLIAGWSQGGQAALFAAGAAERRAPGLRLRGTVAYAPGSHILEQRKLLPLLTEPGDPSRYVALVIKGASTVSRRIRPAQLLTDQALRLYPQVNERCIRQLAAPDSFGGIAPAAVVRADADTSVIDSVLAQMNPDVRSDRPIFIAQGAADTFVFPFFTDQLHDELIGAGNDVRYTVYPGIDHFAIAGAAQGDVLDWFRSKLPPRAEVASNDSRSPG